ncbi:hypothetical protein DL771_006997 [Monosporascus sp. 5C6A]|nr:hypothetical protein DL771_006997 [Monosporascus sp. 5C6A]
MAGSQISKDEDAPRYTPGTVGCAVCFVLALRNRRRNSRLRTKGLTEEDHVAGLHRFRESKRDSPNPLPERSGRAFARVR